MSSKKTVVNSHRKIANSRRQPDSSRVLIIEAGINVFGRFGFEQATTRMIAKQAKVNLGLLQYYFGGKEALYMACADHIATQMEPKLAGLRTLVESTLPAKGASLKAQSAAFSRLWTGASGALLEKSGPSDWLMFVKREQMSPGKAFDLLYDRLVSHLIEIVSLPVARILGSSAKTDEVMLNTIAILGSIMVFQRIPGIALKAMNWPDLKGERLEQIKAVLLRQSLYGLRVPKPNRTVERV
jgi:TetR/AcrR family transcriptional regulator, regulator of cefoperazone and chloramphenicol sensitivity